MNLLDDFEINLCNKKYKIKKRRVFLPFIGGIGLIIYQELQTYIYLPLVIGIFFFIVFWNFPQLIYLNNTKPLYYEDLFIDTTRLPLLDISPLVKKKFENTFEITLIVTNTLLMSALSDYWLYRTHNTTSYMTIVGVTGGILKIFQIINYSSGTLILIITRRLIKKEVLRNKNNVYNESKETEMMNLNVENNNINKVKIKFLESQVSVNVDKIPQLDSYVINKQKRIKPRLYFNNI